MKSIIRFKVFGWHVALSRVPFRTKERDKNRNQYRTNAKKRRLEIAGSHCEICGKPIDISCSLHHRLPAGSPDRNNVDNVMVLCSACHHELEARPHFHGIRHLEDNTRYDTDRKPDSQEHHEETDPR